jgi:hypothetical protein
MKFGVREICDVTFKAAANNQKVGNKVFKKYQPVFMIDTARTSNMEQASTTVYAQGGRGYSRLIAWEGEKTMTFTVEDALMSPMGLAVLSGAGLIKHDMDNSARVHVTVQTSVESNKVSIDLDSLREETGLATATKFLICNKIPMYATTFANDGATGFYSIETPAEAVEVAEGAPGELTLAESVADGTVVVVDFYLAMTNSVTTVEIGPEDFGGYYYVEAQTLFRDEATGKDLAASLTFPKVKIQSGFTFTMAASGDPSTFTFTMDAFPGYALCKPEKKTMCDIQIISAATAEDDDDVDCKCDPDQDTPSFPESWDMKGTRKIATVNPDMPSADKAQENQDAVTVSFVGDDIDIQADVDALNEYASSVASQGTHKWVGLIVNTGEDSIIGVKYNDQELAQADVDEAATIGGGAGEFALWIKADEVVTTPKVFTLAKDGKKTRTITVNVNDI